MRSSPSTQFPLYSILTPDRKPEKVSHLCYNRFSISLRVGGRLPVPLIERAHRFLSHRAIIAPEGTLTYRELVEQSQRVATNLLHDTNDLNDARIIFLVPAGRDYVVSQWGIWQAGATAVPLSLTETTREITYKVTDTNPTALIAHPNYMETLLPLAQGTGIPIHCTTDLLKGDLGPLPEIDPSRNAMILYTSGTTSDPKGVVTTHSNIESQITTLVQAWEWAPDDHILDHLPLHHVHGIINAMACALWVGATCELLPRFDAQNVWNRIADRDLTLYMAVPTVYKALIAAWDEASQADQERWTAGCKAMRLMVSGSDALPVDTFERWEKVSGHRLLERYGMTEIGMALSNPLDGDRIPGQVGTPLPGVDVELIRLDLKKFEETGRRQYGGKVTNRDPGELIVKGPSVFKEYWMKPDMTAEVFDTKGWFYTGDIASLTNEGAYRIWGRASQDLIISGGENVSALEVQRELLKHPDIDACAVVGVEDRFWGRAVSAAIVTVKDSKLDKNSLREWAKERLAPYKVPQNVLILDDLPRNAMGKVLKPQIRTLFDGIES